MKLGILNDLNGHFELYVASCIELSVDYVVIDILSDAWIDNIYNSLDCDGYLVRPTHQVVEHINLYMERINFIYTVLNKPIYPGYQELQLYENKRNMATWLKHNGYPMCNTHVFIDKQAALNFLRSCSYPIVVKANTGSGASGVTIVKKRSHAFNIANQIFGRFHRLFTFGYPSRRKYACLNLPIYGNAEKHVMLLQEYHPIKWEWRIIKIGESYFGHQKLLKSGFASGSLLKGWVAPPRELLDLTRSICDKGGFFSMAVDIFETIDGNYLVNELQCLFGSRHDSQMYINGIPGRYKYIDGEYVFEEGLFNRYGSYLLRVEHFVKMLNEQRGSNA